MLLLVAPLPHLPPALLADWLLARVGPLPCVVLRGSGPAEGELAEALLHRLPTGAVLEELQHAGGLPGRLDASERPVVIVAAPQQLQAISASLSLATIGLSPGCACRLGRAARGSWEVAWQAAPSFAAPPGADSGAQQ